MAAFKKQAMLSYWDGDSWENVVVTGTTTSAIFSLDIIDELNIPKSAAISIFNPSANPYSGSAGTAKGPYTGVFTDFIPVRVIDLESNVVIFYGVVYSIRENFDPQFGMLIHLECRDYLIELRDNISHGEVGYNIDTSVATSAVVTNFADSNITSTSAGQVWSTSISARSALIKSLINRFSSNLDTSDTTKFIVSAQKFKQDFIYRLSGYNKKSILRHVADNAMSELHSAIGEDELFGYDFYVDPNTVTTSTATKSTPDFNYFRRGTRPNTDPANYGLTVQYPTTSGATETGRLFNMSRFNFIRPKDEIYTSAILEYLATKQGANADKSFLQELRLEALTVKAVGTGSALTTLAEALDDSETAIDVTSASSIAAGQTIKVDDEEMYVSSKSSNTLTVIRGSNGTAAAAHDNSTNVTSGFTWGGKNLSGGTDALNTTELLQCRLDGSGDPNGGTGASGGTLTDVARIQYINRTKGTIDTNNVAYVLISNVDQGKNASVFADGVIWYGKTNTAASFTIKSRPQSTLNITRTAKISTSESSPEFLRERVASTLIKNSNTILRGSFSTRTKPISYFDNSPSAIDSTSSTTQTYTLANVGTTAQLSTLGAAISSITATTLTVASSSSMAAGQTIKIDSEEMTIASVSDGTTIVVVRAVNQDVGGGVAATHSDTTAIYNVSGNPLNNGVRVGTAIAELDSSSNPTTTYGYVSAVTATQVTVTWATGVVATDSIIRYYVPVRAGDVIKVTNNLADVDQIFLVAKIAYSEQVSGIMSTQWEVIGHSSAAEGGYSRRSNAVMVQDEIAYETGLAVTTPSPSSNLTTELETNLTIRPVTNNSVAWGDGTFNTGTGRFPDDGTITVGDLTLTIEEGTTNSTSFMINEWNGNPGQSGTTMAADESYYIYYTGQGTALKAVMKKNYEYVSNERTFVVFEAIASAPLASYTWKIDEPSETTTVTSNIFGATVQESDIQVTDSGANRAAGTTEKFKVTSADGGVTLKLRSFDDTAEIEMSGNSGSGTMIMKPHGSISSTYTLTFPNGPAGTDNHVLTADGTSGATDWAASSSSKRYKENIREMELDSSKIYDLTPKSFDYIDGHVSLLGGTKFGYIAEDIEDVLPEVIQYNKEGQPDSLHYQLITVLLVEEIKKLKAKVEDLESKDHEEKSS